MARPQNCRRVTGALAAGVFKPAGASDCPHEEVRLTLDEVEALRLADLEGLYQAQAAERMRVSRATFGRIVESARGKVARALVEGRALRIEGGVIETPRTRTFRCCACAHNWTEAFGKGPSTGCPECGGTSFKRIDGTGHCTQGGVCGCEHEGCKYRRRRA